MQPIPSASSVQTRQQQDQQVRQSSGPVAFLLDLLFPPQCIVCNRVDTTWCHRCQQDFAHIPITEIIDDRIEALSGIAATGHHDGTLQKMVHALKYEQAIELAKPLAQRLHLRLQALNWSPDCIIGVPLHPLRQHERGYNQAHLLATELATLCDLPERSNLMQRDSFTKPQVGLDRTQRLQNVANAFSTTADVHGQRVLLVDDVFTTGATLSACAKSLLAGGATTVYGLTITAAA